ncbi:unnamed protein product [Rangifer tarandus platyrhynchus]|uniref:Uncharacterized protein n=1 Tax=Rangifer tarandus platyrhynchus TaxID=3082113 RepID=A0ACB1KD83_RANTA
MLYHLSHQGSYYRGLVKKSKAHLIIRVFIFFFLCFYFLVLRLGSSGGGGRTFWWCSSCCRDRSTSPHMAGEAADADTGQSLYKQAWPETVNVYTSCLNEGTDLILCDHHLTGQNEDRVGARMLRDRGHGVRECSVGLLARCQSPDEVRASPQNGLGFLEGPSTLVATEERDLSPFLAAQHGMPDLNFQTKN